MKAKDNLPWVCEESLAEMEQELARGIARAGTTVPKCLILEIRRLQAENRRLRQERERLFEWAVDAEQLAGRDYNTDAFVTKEDAVSRIVKAMVEGDFGCPEVQAAIVEHDRLAELEAQG